MMGSDAIDAECGDHLRHPFLSIFVRSAWNGARIRAVHDAWPRLRRWRIRPFGRRRDQRLDELVPEADDLIGAHVAADHAVRQARLKRLIDDAAVGREIAFAACS